ncbi:serine hydrolase domain-containing protein [Mesorhizobium australicum]|uniref:CubicO group peptidase, beta-lactamase class C family n=1 Tax=Mesorhizobium australicum TaxID=536018 RepID=A0A1X7NI88_9HYPH|nr:serine hydrolase [Mesorhizobium australicum]SMH36886.1 CubicO group peptidase, beta-lactamase class C family [Mesorhizobium australicum]
MSDQPLKPRDPSRPGDPIIPRDRWDIAPYHRWTFQHIREMTATAQIWRGAGPARPLPEAKQDLAGVTFQLGDGKRTVAQFLDESFTDGFLVLHRGKIVFEDYRNGMRPHCQHLAMSVTKSVTGILTGILAHRGVLDVEAPITEYLPELSATAYKGAKVQHILDMTSGVVFDESYTTPGSHMQKIDQACGWKVYTRTDWPRTMWQLILTLDEAEREHGELFKYRSIETDVLGFVLERATATPLAELISQEIWAPMGAGEDAYITVDDGGAALADGGLCGTLRDYGRFAQLLLDNGARDGRQIVPSQWIEATRNGRPDLFQGIYRTVLPEGAYSNKFWIEDGKRRAMWARGVFGQSIYIDPESDFAVVKLSTWPEHSSAERSLELLAAMRAIRSALGAD